MRFDGANVLPWQILDECPAEHHNVQRAALRGPHERRCICPRAVELKRRQNRTRAAMARLAIEKELLMRWVIQNPAPLLKRERRIEARTKQQQPLGGRPAGALVLGRCASPEGRALMDQIVDTPGGGTSDHRMRRFRMQMCDRCPFAAKQACAQYVTENEWPAGSWLGMYAGMSPGQRRARAKEESRAAA